MDRFCYYCGEAAVMNENGYYVCPAHKELWLLHRNAPTADGVVIHQGRVLLIRRKHNPGAGMWAVPGGFLELGEHPFDGAMREVFEETGIVARPIKVCGVFLQKASDADYRQITSVVAEYVSGDPEAGDDATDCKWWDLTALPQDMVSVHRDQVAAAVTA